MGSIDHHLGAYDMKNLRFFRTAGSKSTLQQEPQLAQHTQECRSLLAGGSAWFMMSGRPQCTAHYTASLFPLLDEENHGNKKRVQEKIIYVRTFMYFMACTLLSTRAIQYVSHIPHRNVQPSDSPLSSVSSRTNKSMHETCLMRILRCLQNLFCKYMKIIHNPNIY